MWPHAGALESVNATASQGGSCALAFDPYRQHTRLLHSQQYPLAVPAAGEATMLAADSTAREAVAAVSAVTRRLERLQQRYAEAGPSRWDLWAASRISHMCCSQEA